MISEFIYMEILQRSDYSVTYTCHLPDPDIYGDFSMVLCGYVNLREDVVSGDCTVRIELMDNFEQLCIGDTYQREDFLKTVLYMLRRDTCFELDHAKIVLKDFMGSYVGTPIHEMKHKTGSGEAWRTKCVEMLCLKLL